MKSNAVIRQRVFYENVKKYLPFIIAMVFIVVVFQPYRTKLNHEWFGIVMMFIGIILLFEYIEKSRTRRSKKWAATHNSKLVHILKFSLFYGLPISLTIIFLIRKKVELLYSFLFIALSLIIIFGWIGLLDWNNCNKEFLKTKYKVNL